LYFKIFLAIYNMIKVKLKEFHTAGEPYNDLTQHNTITGARYEEGNKMIKVRIKSKMLMGEDEHSCDCGCNSCGTHDTSELEGHSGEHGDADGAPDKNMDGVLSADELEHHFDLNSDGEVTPYEYAYHIEWHLGHPEVLRDRVKKAIGDYREQKIELEEEIWSGADLEDGTPVCEACLVDLLEKSENSLFEAKYRGRTVKLNKPMRGDVKKFKVFVRDPSTGNIKKVNFGDKKMRIKKSNPKRRKSFRARHNCKNPGPKTKARYWSCRKW
jgi:hypothetical protein